jgi:hypothetical protein
MLSTHSGLAMKKILIVLLLGAGIHVQAQSIDISKFRVTMEAGDLTLNQAFNAIKYSAPVWKLFPASKFFYELYVIKDGKTYYKPYLPFMRRNRAYLVTGSRFKKIAY